MINNKTVFITGSSSGIGFHLARLFKESNYEVIINGRNLKKLKKLQLNWEIVIL